MTPFAVEIAPRRATQGIEGLPQIAFGHLLSIDHELVEERLVERDLDRFASGGVCLAGIGKQVERLVEHGTAGFELPLSVCDVALDLRPLVADRQ